MKKNGCPCDSMENVIKWREENHKRRRITQKESELIESKPREEQTHTQEERARDISHDDFFDDRIRISRESTEIAYQLFRRAAAGGSASMVAQHQKNLSEALKAGSIIEGQYIELQERKKKLIDYDEVMCGLAGEVAEWRRMLLSLGSRLTGRITPEAAQIVDAAVDEIMKRTDGLEPMGKAKFQDET
jgi:hypothetical protein